MLCTHQGKGAQCGGVVVDGLQIACHDDLRRLLRGVCGPETHQIDDVGHHLGRHAVAAEDVLQEPRGHHEAPSAPHRGANAARRALQELGRLAAPVVDDHRHAARVGNPHGRRSEQVPRPARVGHHVQHIAAAGRAPQQQQIGQQPEQRAHPLEWRHPGRPVRGVGGHQGHVGLGSTQQLGQLLGLHGHATRRGRQGPHQTDAKAGQACHAAASTPAVSAWNGSR